MVPLPAAARFLPVALTLALIGCAGPAPAPDPRVVEHGRQLFAAHCARCHGADARGGAEAPNLRQRVQGMSEGGFANAVLQRYRWKLPAAEAAGEGGAREALLRGLLSRSEPGSAMPAWQTQPGVAAGVSALYAHLNAAAP
jgi:mono/diheme cytochrome c family protein